MKKWVVRGLVFFCLGGMGLVGLAYQYWTNPEAVRRQVLARLQHDFVNVQASGDLAVGLADQIKTLEKKTATLEHDVSALKAQLATLQAVALRNPRLGPPVHRLRAADHRELAAVIAAILAEVE